MSDGLLAGIEIGSTRAVLDVSDGRRLDLPSPEQDAATGTPESLGRDQMGLSLACLEAVAEELAKPSREKTVRAVVASPHPPQSRQTQKLRLLLRTRVDRLLVVSKTFATAYTLDSPEAAVVVDIGARCAEISALRGGYPDEGHRVVLEGAGGDAIDRRLMDEMEILAGAGSVARRQAQSWKERHGFTGPRSAPLPVGVASRVEDVDVRNAMRRACESILPPLAEAIDTLLAHSEPEEARLLRGNIVVGGGTAWIQGLPAQLEARLRTTGATRVRRVQNPTFACAQGALAIARDLTAADWDRLAVL